MKKKNLKTVYYVWKNGLLKKRNGEPIKSYNEVMRQIRSKLDYAVVDNKVFVDVDKLKNKYFTRKKK